MVGAHIDHLGSGPSAGSLARDDESTHIHYGADDNASGVAAILQIAEALAAAKEQGELRAHRDIVFAAWSGEELGLLGSSHFVRDLETTFAQHAADASAALSDSSGEQDSPKDASAEETEDLSADDKLSGPTTGGLHMYIAA